MPTLYQAKKTVETDKQTATMGESVKYIAQITPIMLQSTTNHEKNIKETSDKTIKNQVPYYNQEVFRAHTLNYPNTEDNPVETPKTDEIVIFKINGVTIKDKSVNPIKCNVTNNIATLDYTIPDGWSAKPIKITAVFRHRDFERVENKTYMNITKISTYINYKQVKYSDKTLKIQAEIKDNNNHTVLGRNILAIKINGITIKRTSIRPQYYTVENGIINLNITTAHKYLKNGVSKIQIVTGDRNAYLGCRKEYTIKIYLPPLILFFNLSVINILTKL